MHSEAISLIESEVARIETELSASGADQLLVGRKNAFLKSLRLLRQMSSHDVAAKAKIHSLPFPQSIGSYSTFRLMEDHETDDRTYWTELKIDGKPVQAIVGDIVIINSNRR